VDLDSDGRITAHEMQYFYEEQLHRMECMAQEPVLFEDIVCQMADMIKPEKDGVLRLQDLKRCKLSGTSSTSSSTSTNSWPLKRGTPSLSARYSTVLYQAWTAIVSCRSLLRCPSLKQTQLILPSKVPLTKMEMLGGWLSLFPVSACSFNLDL